MTRWTGNERRTANPCSGTEEPGIDGQAPDGFTVQDKSVSTAASPELLAAQRELIDQVRRAVARACRALRYFGELDHDDLSSMVLEKFVKRPELRRALAVEPAQLKPLTWRVAWNTVFDANRRRWTKSRTSVALVRNQEEHLADPSQCDPTDFITVKSILAQLRQTRDEKSKLRAEVLSMASLGMSHQDIARQTGVPKATVGYWLKTSRASLGDLRD